MYLNSGSGSVASTPTAAQLTAIQTYIAAQQKAGAMVGFSDQQIADALNAPTTVPNPQPNPGLASIPTTPANLSILVTNFSKLFGLAVAANAAQAILLVGMNQAIVTQMQLLQQQGLPIVLSSSLVQGFIADALALQNAALTAASIATALYFADPAITPTISGMSWAYENLGGAWLMPADVLAATGS